MGDRPITVLHKDRRLLFAAKPARMLTVAAPGVDKGRPLEDRLRDQGHDIRPVHRLDFETTGAVVFARDDEMAQELIGLFRERKVKKTYLALVQGHPRSRSGTLDQPIRDLGATAKIAADGKPAVTHYEVLEKVGPCALVRLRPETGRHNQIRLHMGAIGHPLVGERKFARGRDAVVSHRRVLLHAATLGFHPSHLEHALRIRCPLPADFERVLKELGGALSDDRRDR